MAVAAAPSLYFNPLGVLLAAAVRAVAVAPRRPLHIFLPLMVAIVGVLGVLGYALSHGAAGGRTNALIGKPAPKVVFSSFAGESVDVAALQGKPIVVNFWGSWCVPCRDEFPVLQQAWQRYHPQDVQFIGLAVWDKAEAAQAFARDQGAGWTNGLDEDGKIAIDFGVYGVPETYFIDRQGILADRYVGPFTGSDGAAKLDQYVRTLLAR